MIGGETLYMFELAENACAMCVPTNNRNDLEIQLRFYLSESRFRYLINKISFFVTNVDSTQRHD